jgi:8-oxo-dGTP pyrophosphatase MutT (NUDIX family)
VLVPVYGWPHAPGLVFTERRHDLRRHAGEISFPGGRRDPGEELVDTALREAEEEIGLDPAAVRVVGALEPISTVVTGYKVLPFVGLVPPGLEHRLQPTEVERVLEFSFDELREGFGRRRLIRRGVPFRTPTYVVGEHLIWGATGRMLELFFGRLDRAAGV